MGLKIKLLVRRTTLPSPTIKEDYLKMMSKEWLLKLKNTSLKMKLTRAKSKPRTVWKDVFNLRNTMNDENVGGKLDAADKEAITKIVDETIAWMDSTYEVLEKDVYDAKQKEVEAIVNPIMTKLYQQAGAGAGGMGGMPGGMPAGFDPSQFGGAAPGAGAPNEPQVDDID